ncbi:RING finger protein 17 [Astyanax mexicanus]|uniref:RING finger protein 17 n=1 Tax=Astyanax mexicanus TaxID=7994 RepID=A0A8B9JHN1_ASTMX|nr:RING finger protein 17 [Astyanax mexicanus]
MSDSAVTCNNCGLPYTLPEDDEVVGNVPHVLLCGHIFCTVCLLESPRGFITCHECKMVTNVGEEGVDGLQVDSRIIGLIYTARMNTKKRQGDKLRARKFRSPSASPPARTEHPNTEVGPDMLKVLDEALCKATENLNTLDNLHQTLTSGIHAQLKKERSRITKEIEDCTEKAIGMLHKRRSVLMSELSSLEQLFSDGREECQKLEERRKEMRMAIQKAKHVRQVPSLGTYCHLDKVLETLETTVDVGSYDMSSLTLCSKLRCVLHVDILTDSLSKFLYLMDGDVKLVSSVPAPEERAGTPAVKSRWEKSGERRGGRSRGRARDSMLSLPAPASDQKQNSPNVIIEEIIEESDSGTEREGMVLDSKRLQRQKVPRRSRKAQKDRTPLLQCKALQEWVVLTHVVNPTHFYVRLVSEHKAGVALTKKVNKLCFEEHRRFMDKDEIKTGMLVFVRWKDDWCRAKVCELFQKGCLECVTQCCAAEIARLQVFFQDHGFTKGLTFSDEGGLRGLNECLRKVDSDAQFELHHWAPQAIRCSLRDIIPSDLVKGWSAEARDEMRRVIGSGAVEMQVFSEDRDTLLVDLKKASVDDILLSLREHLVFMELARFYSPQVAPSGSKPLQFYPPVHPKLNLELHAVVSYVNTPSDFYVQLVDSMEFLLLNSKLQDCYGPPGSATELQIYCPCLGQACVALCEKNKDWCRAEVTGFPGGRMVEVQYVDFGNKKTVSINDLRQIKDEFFALPAMALWCSLVDVTSVGDSWSEESIEVFRKMTEQNLVTLVVSKLVPHSKVLPVRLYEVSKCFTEPAVSIGEILVKRELASLVTKQVQLKEIPLPDTAVWDPPLSEEHKSPDELLPPPPPPTVEPPELQVTLNLPACLKDLRVRVTHVTSPGHICVQLLQFDNQLKRVHDLMNRGYLKSDQQEVDWKVEMSCAANVNGVWERGKVCSVSTSNISEVLRCDFGNTVKLHISNLRPLLPELVGSLLLECCLSDIRPAGGRSTWTATACDFISYYLTGATAVMTIKDASARPAPVSLFCSNRSGQDVSIADFLISEGLALRERTVKVPPTPKPPSAVCEEQGAVSGESVLWQDECVPGLEEAVCEKSSVKNETPLCSYSPRPAPLTTPSPEKVKTQAYLPPEFPPCGHTRMSISAVSDDGVIYAMTPQAECEFERLKDCLQQHIKTLPRQRHYNWKSVLGCAVMGSDMLWYRGQVQEVIGGHVKVQYVDQGIVENIPVCHVYPVVLCENIPQLSVPCQLNGVIPVGGSWQWDAVALMKELLLGRSVSVQIMELPENLHGLVTVEIILDGMALSRIMVNHQHASFDPSISIPEDYVVKPPVPDLDDWDLNTKGLEELQPVLGVFTNPTLPDKGKQFRVKVKHLRTPNEVFLSLVDMPMCDQKQETLQEALEQVNKDIDSLPQLTDFPMEGPCLAEYSDGLYYRAKLLGFTELNPSIKILVRHVDYGSDDILPPCKLRCLPPSLLQFPCEAVCVRLAGFKPPHVCVEVERISYRPEWSMKSMLEMIDLLHGNLSAVVTGVEPQLTVVLYRADKTLVHVPLVEKGLADYE